MKYFRLASLLVSTSVLASLVIGTFASIFSFFGFLGGLKMLATNPDVLICGLYETIGNIGLNLQFWAWNGPLVALGLLILVLVNSIGSDK